MLNFDFYNPTHILFGKGRIADLNKVVPSDAKVLLMYGGGSIKKNGVFDEVISALGGREISEFSEVRTARRPDSRLDKGFRSTHPPNRACEVSEVSSRSAWLNSLSSQSLRSVR